MNDHFWLTQTQLDRHPLRSLRTYILFSNMYCRNRHILSQSMSPEPSLECLEQVFRKWKRFDGSDQG